MPSLQQKGDSWYCQFMYQQQRRTITIGKVDETEAKASAARIDYLLMRIRQRLLTIPEGVDIVTFIEHDGKPPVVVEPVIQKLSTTFLAIRDAYMKTMSNGALENNTLYTMKIQLGHIERTLGKKFPMETLELPKLQEHIDRRRNDVCALTIKKEINALRAAWYWACRMKLTQGAYPSVGLVYPKSDEKLPFMTYAEIERRIDAGAIANGLWGCLYLKHDEVEQLLDHVQNQDVPKWIYPAFVFVAHTGSRRSEMMRASLEDIDISGKIVTIKERKRKKGQRTSRRVPMSSRLEEVMRTWINRQNRRGLLFSDKGEGLSPKAVEGGFAFGVQDSQWEVMRGWHTLRHSFISALASKGVDQRLIDDFVGHQTEEQRRRYRHLYPSTQQEAIRSVFG